MDFSIMNGKVRLFSILLISLVVRTASAQILIGPVIGVQSGVTNFKDKTYKNFYSQRPYIGFHGGASVSLRLEKRIYLQTHILYSRRGRILEGKADQTFENKATYNFIDMPILFTKEFKMRFGKGKYYNLYFGIGPSISYWLGGKGTLKGSDLNENLINPPDYILPYKIVFKKNPESDTVRLGEMNVANANRIQLGLNFTAGVVFEPIGMNRFMFTVRYELGHSYFSPDDDGDFGGYGIFYQDDLQARLQSLALSLYYFIDLKTDERNRGRSTLKLDKLKR